MEQPITADGTVAFYVRPGRYLLTFGYTTLDAGAVVALKGGYSDDGTGHTAMDDQAGTAVEVTGGAAPQPHEIACAGYLSLVTTGFGTTTGLKASFRRIPSC